MPASTGLVLTLLSAALLKCKLLRSYVRTGNIMFLLPDIQLTQEPVDIFLLILSLHTVHVDSMKTKYYVPAVFLIFFFSVTERLARETSALVNWL